MSCTQIAFDEGGLVPDDACRTRDAPMTKHASVIASKGCRAYGQLRQVYTIFFQHVISQKTLKQIASFSFTHRT